MLPGEISLSGFSFDSDETAWGIFGGWRVRDWVAVELGYRDLGNTGQDLRLTPGVFGTPLFTPTITVPPPVPFVPPDGFITSAFPLPDIPGAALSAEEWSVTAKFRKDLTADWSANWTVGISRTDFEAEGSLTINELVSTDPFIFNTTSIPYASPDAETGFVWGLGFGWQATDAIELDLGFRQNKSGVIDIESASLRLNYLF